MLGVQAERLNDGEDRPVVKRPARQLQRLDKALPKRELGIERNLRVLKENLNFAPRLPADGIAQPLAVEKQLAGIGFEQADHHLPQRGFAAAALAEQAERFAPLQGQRRTVHRGEPRLIRPAEAFGQRDGLHDGFTHTANTSLCGRPRPPSAAFRRIFRCNPGSASDICSRSRACRRAPGHNRGGNAARFPA